MPRPHKNNSGKKCKANAMITTLNKMVATFHIALDLQSIFSSKCKSLSYY